MISGTFGPQAPSNKAEDLELSGEDCMRIEPASIDLVDERTKRVLEAQTKKWGAPLVNHLVYARVPAIFGAVRGMWGGLGAAAMIDESLQAMVNRRVAQINGCEF